MDGSPKDQLIEKLKSANNVLVTVSRDPSVDQLASLLGLTLLLNKQGKHAAAVYSGETPSTIEFLQPEDTFEKNTDSLRDFIIALDKSKADKLRYKVEDNVVRIFITPYKTSLSEEDFEFSQGDFNIDLVVAIGVKQQEDLDQAITAHGRILHDAVVASINVSQDGGLGTINWHDPQASSLSELVTEAVQGIGADLLDEQIATALLTGIVAETERFSNDKTSSQTMSASAALMSAGANQQLVASKLEEGPGQSSGSDNSENDKSDDGTLEIDHAKEDDQSAEPNFELPKPEMSTESEQSAPETEVESAPPPPEAPAEQPAPGPGPEAAGSDQSLSSLSPGSQLVTEPPTMGGTLTANTTPEDIGGTTDPLSTPGSTAPHIIERNEPAPQNAAPFNPANSTLSDIEQSVNSPHAAAAPAAPENVDAMRNEVDRALAENPYTPGGQPIQALNAQPLGENLNDESAQADPNQGLGNLPTGDTSQADSMTPPVTSEPTDANTPPPVPPPIPFQFGAPSNNQQNQ